MRRQLILLLFLTVAMAVSLPAATMTFSGDLSGLNESPTNMSPGNGITFVTIDTVAHTLKVEAIFDDLEGFTTAAHIHIRTPPMPNGGVVTTVPTFLGFPLDVKSGAYSATFSTVDPGTYNPSFLNNPVNLGNVEIAEANLLAGLIAGNAYLNIHSTLYGGGEIRGNLSAVPEPGTIGLAAAALGALGWLRRRRA